MLKTIFGLAKIPFNVARSRSKPLENILEKTAFFISPQMAALRKEYNTEEYNEIITFESIGYIIALVEAIGGRTVLLDEYSLIINYIFNINSDKQILSKINKLLLDPKFDRERHITVCVYIRLIAAQMKKIAKNDVRVGIISSSNFLVNHAKEVVGNPALQNKYNMGPYNE